MSSSYHIPYRTRRTVAAKLLALLVLVAARSEPLPAQSIVSRVGGPHAAAHVQVAPRTGRFWITSGYLSRDSLRLLFGTPSHITSNVIFRVQNGPVVRYFCNAPEDGEARPQIDGRSVPYRPFDEIRESNDTLALTWRDLDGFDVTMRFIPDQDAWSFVNGGDVLIEFEYALRPGAPPATLGIALMLDLFNNDRGTEGSEDRTEILSEYSYHRPGEYPLLHRAPAPGWYLFGKFTSAIPRTRFFGVHRLAGAARSGATLTPPDLVSFNRWEVLRTVAWDPPGTGSRFFDCASFVRWSNLINRGVVRTAFGPNDSSGNDFAFGTDATYFVALRSARLIRGEPGATPTPDELVVDAFLLKSGGWSPEPEYRPWRLAIWHDGTFGTPRWLVPMGEDVQGASVDRQRPLQLTWRYRLVGDIPDTTLMLRLQSVGKDGRWTFLERGGTVVLRIVGNRAEPDVDRASPLLLRVDSTVTPDVSWTLRTRDVGTRGTMAGIDRVMVRSLTSSAPASDSLDNVRTFIEPEQWMPCDTGTITVRVAVADTTRPAACVVEVDDCYGNRSRDTLVYRARPSKADDVVWENRSAPALRLERDVIRAGEPIEIVIAGAAPHSTAAVRVIDLLGRVVHARTIERSELDASRVTIASSMLAPGMHIVEVVGDGHAVGARVLVLRQ